MTTAEALVFHNQQISVICIELECGEKMGNPPEKQEITTYAKEKINFFLHKREYHIALLLSYIYVGIRLRSLITDWAKTPEPKWKEASLIFGRIGFRGCTIVCKQLGLLKGKEMQNLDELRKKRNDVAHESRMWKERLQQSEEKKIKSLCECAIAFLERTS